MKRKAYQAPLIRKVRLVVRSAVLGFCHSSPDNIPLIGVVTCAMAPTTCLTP